LVARVDDERRRVAGHRRAVPVWIAVVAVIAGRVTHQSPVAALVRIPGYIWHALPLVFYTQWIGEDEAGGLPSKFIGQFGLETWGGAGTGNWRLRAEYTDTACNFTRSTPEFGCAYRNAIYPQGYAYRGRIIGSSMDNDSRMFTIAGLLARANGDVLEVTVRQVELNRDGGPHAISTVPLDVENVELRYSRVFGPGIVRIGVGYDEPGIKTDSSRAHGFVNWQQGF